MRKIFCFLPFFLLAIVFASCDETKETSKYDNWKQRNEAFIDSIKDVFESGVEEDILFRQIDNRDKTQYIYYKKIKSNDNGERPYYTSNVTTFFRAMLINESAFSLAKAPEYYYAELYNNLDIVVSNFKDANPTEFDSPTTNPLKYFTVGYGMRFGSESCSGSTEILQQMRVGERWEVYMPWECAYGSTTRNPSSTNVFTYLFMSVPAYSALIMDVELVGVDNPK